MKSLILILFLLLWTPAAHAADIVRVAVPDATCEACAEVIVASLEKNPAVKQARVDVEKRVAIVTLKDDQTVSDKELRADIDKTGFTAGAVTR